MATVSAVPPGMPAYGLASGTTRRFNGRVAASLVMSIVALILTVISGMMPWWSMSTTSNVFGTPTIVTADFHLGNVCSTGGFPGLSACLPYGFFSGIVPGFAAIGNTFGLSALLMGFALLVSILMVLFSIVGALWPRVAIVNVALGLGGAALTLVAPIFLMVALPGVLNNLGGLGGGGVPIIGFWGSSSVSGTTAQWGASVGWYLAFASGAIFIVAAALAVSARRSVLPLGNFRMPSAVPSLYSPPPYPPPMYPAQAYSPYPGYAAQPPSGPVQPYSPSVQQYSAPPAPVPPAGAPASPWGSRRCPACGNAITQGPTVCPHCGTNVA